ncbi:unnamed protein product [Brachionus calyciflorus]|uniref:Phosphodiesterase n=1 Tax=Brachionus calyciflorus TaxID=104777 RepID=A0A813NH36_9BILA|nr:unnamed protein product [Brachionus calyciflorus]
MSNLSVKLIYVRIDNRIECIEFDSNTSTEDLKETFRSAAEANPNDILKLYNFKGNLVSINNSLPVNISNEPYKLQVIVKNIVDYNNELRDLIDRIEHLEIQLNSLSSQRVEDLHLKVKHLCEKLENLDHLSFIGLFKDTRLYMVGNSINSKNSKNSDESKKQKIKNVNEKFKKFSMGKVNEETRKYLKSTSFDGWKFEDAELLVLLQQIFYDLDLVSNFSIKLENLQSYLIDIYSNYNDVPYHNFRHAFTVTQMIYSIICSIKLFDLVGPLEILALIIAGLSHDLDHDGFNNTFQINAQTHLAMIYNDNSPLEMYHCAVAFNILNKPESNIISALDKPSFKKLRDYVVQIILATDMASHNQIMTDFQKIVQEFDFKNSTHIKKLMIIIMKMSDISNECRPINVSSIWADNLMNEFFNQGDHEKLNGLPVTPMMDRESGITKSKSQIGFINFVLLPLAESLTKLFPVLRHVLIDPIKASLEYYKNLEAQEAK